MLTNHQSMLFLIRTQSKYLPLKKTRTFNAESLEKRVNLVKRTSSEKRFSMFHVLNLIFFSKPVNSRRRVVFPIFFFF
jgi:hypothetical protein